ncbi:uncharacterized protein LOC143835699 [Paroedura picta]|uniref:uncharacterized protein LOC143835699 n=1 Tax=Paroedura picta TaxID=143630 RepID=UPI0040576C63
MYCLLCKGNSEILEAVKKVEKEVQDIKKELSDRIDGLEKVVDKNINQLATHQTRIQCVEDNQQERERVAEDKFEVLEVESKARNIKIKGMPEEFGKTDLRKEITESLEDYLEEEEIRIDKVYRVYSKAAARKKQPRDILVSFDSKVIRNNLLQKLRETPLKLADQEIQIFQDLPADTLRKRAQFHFLRQILIAKEIRYFWRIPFALEVILPPGRKTIRMLQQAQELADNLSQGTSGAGSPKTSPTRAETTRRLVQLCDDRSSHLTQATGTQATPPQAEQGATAPTRKNGEAKGVIRKR